MKKILFIFFVFISIFYHVQDSIKLKIYRENLNHSFLIYADNDEFAPVSLEFNYKATNLSSTLDDKSVIVIPAKTKKFLITELKSIDQKKGTHFEDNIYYVLGDVNVYYAGTNFIYDLPFAKNKTYQIYQGYNGKFSHQNAFSLDFSLKQGDQVFAARAGKVVQVITKNNQNCPRKECAKFNNEITIMQSDGTLAEYVHLKQNGSVVQLGEDILKGQLIGYSGSTGWTNGPHLHFSVFVNKIDGQRNYIKTKFRTSNSHGEYLSEKNYYLKNY
jgi:hypothetical protein